MNSSSLHQPSILAIYFYTIKYFDKYQIHHCSSNHVSFHSNQCFEKQPCFLSNPICNNHWWSIKPFHHNIFIILKRNNHTAGTIIRVFLDREVKFFRKGRDMLWVPSLYHGSDIVTPIISNTPTTYDDPITTGRFTSSSVRRKHRQRTWRQNATPSTNGDDPIIDRLTSSSVRRKLKQRTWHHAASWEDADAASYTVRERRMSRIDTRTSANLHRTIGWRYDKWDL